MFKRVLGVTVGIILFFSMQATAFAQSGSTLQADKTRAQVGETVTVSGNWTAEKLLSVKGTDDAGDIVYYGVVRADSRGAFTDAITVPDMDPGILTITAGNENTVSSAQVQIYVQYYYTVTFDKNGGDSDANPIAITVADGSRITTLPVSSGRTGYGFGGWYKDKDCKTTWDLTSDLVSGNITLYAKWNINTYMVKFFCRDGKTQIGSNQTVSWGHAANVETAPTAAGYIFNKWGLVGDNDSVETSLACVKENIVATAIYTRNAAESSQPSAQESGEPSASGTAGSSASASPAPGPTASAEKAVIPVQVEKDNQTGKIKITLDISTLPAGTQALKLPNGSVFKIDKSTKTITLEVDSVDVEKDGTVQVVSLDEKGVPLAVLKINTSGVNSAKTGDYLMIWIIVGAGILALLLFLLYREWRRRKNLREK